MNPTRRIRRLAAVLAGLAVGLTLALPVLFLVVIFAPVFTGTTRVAGGSINASVYDVPGIITLAIIRAASGHPGPRPGPLLLRT